MPRTISDKSKLAVEIWLRGIAPKAASVSNIRDRTMVGTKSIRYICEIYLKGRVEVIESTAGRLYRWLPDIRTEAREPQFPKIPHQRNRG